MKNIKVDFFLNQKNGQGEYLKLRLLQKTINKMSSYFKKDII